MLYKDKGAYYSISLEELISESSATKNVVDSSNFENNSILVKHYITNKNGKLVLDERGSKYMRYTEGLNKYTTELYQNEIYEFTLTSSEYQTQTVVYNNLNPDNIEVAESSLTGNIDNFKGKKVYEIRPITVEKLLGNESLRLAYRLENGKEKDPKHRLGQYQNVLLSDQELRRIKHEFPDWEQRIERLSEYMASTGKGYKSHLATIRAWAKRDPKPVPSPSYDLEELAQRGNYVPEV